MPTPDWGWALRILIIVTAAVMGSVPLRWGRATHGHGFSQLVDTSLFKEGVEAWGQWLGSPQGQAHQSLCVFPQVLVL